MGHDDSIALAQALEELKRRELGRRFFSMFPMEGDYSRFAYHRQWEFFGLGASKRFRLFIGGNGTGKTVAGGYETVCHATGEYPEGWEGCRFERAVTIWVAGVGFKEIRESLQLLLLGPKGEEGTGLIPRDNIIDFVYRSQPSGTIDFVQVRHKSGGTSRIVFKSYEEGRTGFQSASVDFIWLDEEPTDAEIFTECVARFRGETTKGQLILTFTPLFGMSDVILLFIPEFMQTFDPVAYEQSSRAYVYCTMDDVPHISEEEKKTKAANCLPHEREARLYGRPVVGEGKVFPFEESTFVVEPFRDGIPVSWPRICGFDPGLRVGAAVWLAINPDEDVVYVYSESYLRDMLPPVHAASIKARGVWIPVIIDPAGRSSETGISTVKLYEKMGLLLKEADKHTKGPNGQSNVDDGIQALYERFGTGRLKIYKSCVNLIRELRQYARNKKHQIIKHDDHAIDAMRYAVRDLRKARRKHESVFERQGAGKEETFGIFG